MKQLVFLKSNFNNKLYIYIYIYRIKIYRINFYLVQLFQRLTRVLSHKKKKDEKKADYDKIFYNLKSSNGKLSGSDTKKVRWV